MALFSNSLKKIAACSSLVLVACWVLFGSIAQAGGEKIWESPNGSVRLRADQQLEIRKPGASHWELSPLRPPPSGITYSSATIDRMGNLYVQLGGSAQGFNYVGAGGRPVVVASKMVWEGNSAAPLFQAIQGHPARAGVFGITEDGALHLISPPSVAGGSFADNLVLEPGEARKFFSNEDVAAIVGKDGAARELNDLVERPKPAAATAAVTVPKLEALQPVFSERHAPPVVDESQLAKRAAEKMQEVPEFKFLMEEAKRLGIRVWIGGGAAFTYLHYVKQDMLREKGDRSLLKGHFDYDFSHIFRQNQDFDIVADGPAGKLEALQAALERNFPYRQDAKSAWDVRPLRERSGAKVALLNNPDFLQQHLDSASVGLVEISHSTEPPVRDLRAWSSTKNEFLSDVAKHRVKFLRTDLHVTTSKFLAGENPPIIAALRYLAKVTQEDLVASPEDLQEIKAIFAEFKPASDLSNSYVRARYEKIGKKIFNNARNLQKAYAFMDQQGFRQILVRAGDAREKGALAWLMSRRPLGMFPVGQGSGKTAATLGINQISHLTDIEGFDNLLFSHTGKINAFLSVNSQAGQTAVHGDGFYFMKGDQGWSESPERRFNVTGVLRPEAREGTDFLLNRGEVILLNENAFVRSNAELGLSALQYFKKIDGMENIPESEEGLLMRAKARIRSRWQYIPESEMAEVLKMVSKKTVAGYRRAPLLTEWFSFPGSLSHPELVAKAISQDMYIPLLENSRNLLAMPGFLESGRKMVEQAIRDKDHLKMKYLAKYFFSQPETAGLTKEFSALVARGDERVWSAIAEFVYSQPHSVAFKDQLFKLWRMGKKDFIYFFLPKYLFHQPHAAEMRDEIRAIMRDSLKGADSSPSEHVAKHLFSGDQAFQYREELREFIENAKSADTRIQLARAAFDQPRLIELRKELGEFLMRSEVTSVNSRGGSASYIARILNDLDGRPPELDIFRKAANMSGLESRRRFLRSHGAGFRSGGESGDCKGTYAQLVDKARPVKSKSLKKR